MLLRNYEPIAIEKGLNINLNPEFTNKSIDTVVGVHTILNFLPFVTFSDIEKLNAKKAYE